MKFLVNNFQLLQYQDFDFEIHKLTVVTHEYYQFDYLLNPFTTYQYIQHRSSNFQTFHEAADLTVLLFQQL